MPHLHCIFVHNFLIFPVVPILHMKKFILCCIILMLLARAGAQAQDNYNDRAQKYIEKYNALAIQEQKRSGIPAAITLGQGILETEAGASELMTQANNHFGIKCKSDWEGDKFLHTDDAPDECFKRYKCAEDSYKDHSDYLKRNPRYARLFTLKTTDYKSWAVCLRSCGYATNPQYAQNLIKIIETFNLQDYTYSAFDSALLTGKTATPMMTDAADPTPIQHTADSARVFITKKNNPPAVSTVSPDIENSKIVMVNGLKAFYAHKGEVLMPYAAKYKVRYSHLLEMNDLPDGPLLFNSCIYLEKKQTLGTHPTHIVKEGESVLLISQIEGIQVKRLMAMNMLNPNEEPIAGSVLYLQSATAIKPDVKINAIAAHTGNAIVTGADTLPKHDNDYIQINRSESKPTPVVKAAVVHTDTLAAPKHVPVADFVPKPVSHADTPLVAAATPTHVIIVKTETEIPKPKPVVHAYTPAAPVASVEKPEATTEEEFKRLKAELDKVVYADDIKLVSKIESSQPQPKPAEEQLPKHTKFYTVKKGDTAFSVAKKNNISVDELLKMNRIAASGVKIGKNLRVK